MTQVLLSSTATVDGITYASGDLVDFPAATAAAVIAASSGAASPAQDGRTINHAARVAALIGGSDTEGAVALLSQSGPAYTFGLQDTVGVVPFTRATAVAATVPPSSSVNFPLGSVITVLQQGAGTVTITAGGGVTINRVSGAALTTGGQYTACQIIKTATDVWTLFGALG